jgi:sugar phosphate isomerase/epimerase
VGLGYYAFQEPGDIDAFLEKYRPAMQTLAAKGKYFMYHNHDSEFRRLDGRTVLEQLAGHTPPEEMGFTLDTFWVQAGGGDPAWWLERLAGRVPCIHLKDFAYGRNMAVVGEGNLNFDRIFEKAQVAGVRYMLVEQDDCNGEDPFACLKRSYDNLRAFGFR